MCCCGKPIVNGEQGYSWDGKRFGIHPAALPEMEDGDELIRDLPGRCGGTDSHSFDFRLVRSLGSLYLLFHHGGGSGRINLHAYRQRIAMFEALDEDACYWIMATLYHVQSDAATRARYAEEYKWQSAAAEKRIKTRKRRGTNAVKVWIEEAV